MAESRVARSMQAAEVALSACQDMGTLNCQAKQHADRLIAVDQELLLRSRRSLAESYGRLGAGAPAGQRQLELTHLRQADRHLQEARARIDRQRRLIAELRRRDHPVLLAETLLETMLGSLQAMENHRGVIMERLDWLPKDSDRQR
jgi:hypothetical protein